MRCSLPGDVLMDSSLAHLPNVAVPITEGIEALPQDPPAVHGLAFTGRGQGWPPRPVDQQEVRAVPVQELPGLSDELEELIRTAALQDARVAELLGERYVHLGTEPLIAKGRP